MKVTRLMIEEFMRARREFHGSEFCKVEAGLEAALADVPENNIHTSLALRRLAHSEAKLAKVREWASRPTANNERTDTGSEVLAILDGTDET